MSKKIGAKAHDCVCLTVDELQARLQRFDGSTMVMMPGPEGGFLALRGMDLTPVVLNVNSDTHFGPHDVPYGRQKPHRSALVLRPDS
jgi:hypothetical protein